MSASSVSEAGSSRGQFVAGVHSNSLIAREHYRLILSLPSFPRTLPGQFIQIQCRDGDRDYEPTREWSSSPSPGVQPHGGELSRATRAKAGKSSDHSASDRFGVNAHSGGRSIVDRSVGARWSDGGTEIDLPNDASLGRDTADGDELTGPLAFLRRPFSLAGRVDTADGVRLSIIHRVVGSGTDWMSRLDAGDRVHLIGPLGNSFRLPPADGRAILVGGGVGIPPMLYLAEALGQPHRRAIAFAGAVSRDLLPLTLVSDPSRAADASEPALRVEEFARFGIPAILTTDDGSSGLAGFVTQALEQYLESNRGIADPSGPITIYTCGPERMMKRVAEIAALHGVACQVAVERAMACGMGTCQSCCIRVRKADPSKPPLAGKNWCYRLACTDGPVFDGCDLLW